MIPVTGLTEGEDVGVGLGVGVFPFGVGVFSFGVGGSYVGIGGSGGVGGMGGPGGTGGTGGSGIGVGVGVGPGSISALILKTFDVNSQSLSSIGMHIASPGILTYPPNILIEIGKSKPVTALISDLSIPLDSSAP